MSKATLYRYAVSHPDYERVIVNAACPADATMEAATIWAAPWAKIAAIPGRDRRAGMRR